MGHKCGQTELKCFDCRQPICRDCLIELPNSLVCKKCKPKSTARKSAGKFFLSSVRDCAMILLASTFYSFITFALVGFIGFAGMWLIALFVAIIAVGISELLNQVATRIRSRGVELAIVIIGLTCGEVLGSSMPTLLQGKLSGILASSLQIDMVIYLVIIIAAMFFRFRVR